MGKKRETSTPRGESVEDRRSAVRKILAAGSATAGAGAFTWKTPVIESVVLPAHAQTTDALAAEIRFRVLSGQIGDGIVGRGLLDLFLSTAYAQEDSDIDGGCIAITIDGLSVTVTVTRNTGESDTKSGTIDDCTSSFTVENVNGFTVVGNVDDLGNPTTCTGTVGGVDFEAKINGGCSVIPPVTTTTGTPECSESCED